VKQLLVAFLSGILFAVGLAVAGMTQPAKVAGFLDVAGNWDPSLAFVMIGAIAVNAVGWLVARRRAAASIGPGLPPAPSRRLDVPLIGGAAVFGIGWGLSGFCPGPALETAFTGGRAALVFAPAMLAGMGLYRLVAPKLVRALGPVRPPAPKDETGRAASTASACAS
jgi:uncharacterized membrane protein YedE/YeeE